jgi:hypothetical protein
MRSVKNSQTTKRKTTAKMNMSEGQRVSIRPKDVSRDRGGRLTGLATVSGKHLDRYLAELDYRYWTRKSDDGERTVRALDQTNGRRFTYHKLTKESAQGSRLGAPLILHTK